MAMKMHQVHVNGSTVQTVVEVKGRTGHSGFSGGSHKEVPSMQLKLADTQKETGSSREGLPPPPSHATLYQLSLPPAGFF